MKLLFITSSSAQFIGLEHNLIQVCITRAYMTFNLIPLMNHFWLFVMLLLCSNANKLLSSTSGYEQKEKDPHLFLWKPVGSHLMFFPMTLIAGFHKWWTSCYVTYDPNTSLLVILCCISFLEWVGEWFLDNKCQKI